MSWVKLDDQRAMHRKLRDAGFAARGLDEAALCLCSADGTDGFVSDNALTLLGVAHGESPAVVRQLAERLANVGRWREVKGGWEIHDYLLFNPSADEAAEDRRRRQEAGRKGGLRSAASRREAPAEAGPEPNAQAPATAQARANGRAPAVANAQAVPSRPLSELPPNPHDAVMGESGDNSHSDRRGLRSNGTNPRAIGARKRSRGDRVENIAAAQRLGRRTRGVESIADVDSAAAYLSELVRGDPVLLAAAVQAWELEEAASG